MAITLPYSINFGTYGTLSSVYSWYVQYYQYPTNTSTITSSATSTINSINVTGDSCIVNIQISNTDNISRTGTSGYTAPTFMYTSNPTFKIHNVDTSEDIVIYSSSSSAEVVANSNGTASTSAITITQTLDITIPSSWLLNNITITVSDIVKITTTSVTQTNSASSASFYFPFTPKTINFIINWIDDVSNIYNTRPEYVTYKVYKNSLEFAIINISGDNSSTWTNSYTLYLFDGETMSYEYISSLSNYNETITTLELSTTIDYKLYTTSYYSTRLIWVDDDNKYNKRPSSFGLILHQDENTILDTIDDTTTGIYEWYGLPKLDKTGNEYAYFHSFILPDGYFVRDMAFAYLCGKLYHNNNRYSGSSIGENIYTLFLGDLLINNTSDWALTKDYDTVFYKKYCWDDSQAWGDDCYFNELEIDNTYVPQYNMFYTPNSNIMYRTALFESSVLNTTDVLYE